MTGKTLQQLTTDELRGECTVRGISTSGSRADVLIRLEQYLSELGQSPENIRFYPVQPRTTEVTGGTGEQPHASSTLVGMDAGQLFEKPSAGNLSSTTAKQTPTDGQSEHGGLHRTTSEGYSEPTLNADVFRTAAG